VVVKVDAGRVTVDAEAVMVCAAWVTVTVDAGTVIQDVNHMVALYATGAATGVVVTLRASRKLKGLA